jgi:hypothetical protein
LADMPNSDTGVQRMFANRRQPVSCMIQFEQQSLDVVKSVSQRALAMCWARAAANRSFPSLHALEVDNRTHDPKQLVIWQVERSGDAVSFRAMHQGSHVAEAFNSTWTGRRMDEVVPAFLANLALTSAAECARTGCAVYTAFITFDDDVREVACERLLLPFGRKGVVEQIIASLQLISLDGTVRRSKVLKQFDRNLELRCAARISAAAVRKAGLRVA